MPTSGCVVMLEIDGLCVSYGSTEALRDVRLSVQDGEVVCLLGPNGAGKTSFLNAISGTAAYQGAVRFDGDDLRGMGIARIARSGLIHVPEGRRVFPNLSVHENLQMGEVARADRAAAFGYDDVYDLFPALTRLRDRMGFALSGGEQQMVAIGRALIASPRLLMLDEPSLGLAPSVTQVVYAALREIKSTTAMLLVEQSTTDALSLADRGCVLAAGRPVLEGTAAELSDRSLIVASYLGQRDALSDS